MNINVDLIKLLQQQGIKQEYLLWIIIGILIIYAIAYIKSQIMIINPLRSSMDNLEKSHKAEIDALNGRILLLQDYEKKYPATVKEKDNQIKIIKGEVDKINSAKKSLETELEELKKAKEGDKVWMSAASIVSTGAYSDQFLSNGNLKYLINQNVDPILIRKAAEILDKKNKGAGPIGTVEKL